MNTKTLDPNHGDSIARETRTPLQSRATTAGLGPLQIPDLHSPIRDVVANGSPEDEELGQEAAQSIGVSISHVQSHILSPKTPAAEKSAALDSRNAWGFFDDRLDEEQEGMIRDSLYESFIPQSHPDTPPEDELPKSTPFLAPPSPTVRQLVAEGAKPRRSRSRAGSAAAILGELNLKRFMPSFGAKTSPRESRPVSRDGTAEPHVRAGRSNTILGTKISWANGLTLRPNSRDPSPRRGSGPGHRRMISSPMPIEDLAKPVEREIASQPPRPQIQRLRKSASHDSIAFSALSRVSSMDGYERFAHIDSQVNTRAKAMRNIITDNLPSLSTINFSALKPEFSFTRANGALPKSISTVFLGSNRAREAEPVAESPTRTTFTNPRYPSLEEALDNLTGDVVVLGGYRGSTLRSAEPPHRQLWAPIKIGLNMRQVDLEVGLNPEDEENMEEKIFPSGMLTHVGPIDISRRLLKRMRRCRNSESGELRVHDWGYDWRLSPALLTKRLIQFLEAMPSNQPDMPSTSRGVTVIAHSLGGLITRKAINERPELFAGVVYVGTPQFCVNILGPFRNGDDVLLSSKILTAQVNFTLRTSFALLPESGQCFIDIDNPQKQYHVNFFNVEDWKKYAFSPCISRTVPALAQPEHRRSIFQSLPTFTTHSTNGRSSPPSTSDKLESKVKDLAHPVENTLDVSMSPPPPPATASTLPLPDALSYLTRTLAETLSFKKSLHHNPAHQSANAYPPMSVLYSTSLPTVYGAKVAGREGIARADAYDNLAFASGDGVVLARAAMLPRGYKCAPGGRVRTERGHVSMLGDLDAVGKCLLAVVKARRKGVGWGREFAVHEEGAAKEERVRTAGDGIGDGRPF